MTEHRRINGDPTVPPAPDDAEARRAITPVICYPTETLPRPDLSAFATRRESLVETQRVIVPPRDGRSFRVSAGGAFRITCPEGSQVGDLNLWHAGNLTERFFSGKTRALHGTHVSIGDRLWSSFPHLRPMATVIADSLAWYGRDTFGGGVHDVIGTRCDPYTHALLSGGEQYHHCCHSNLIRALVAESGMLPEEAERHVHDVLNVFMCTGFTADTGQYFMKASPARKGDHIEFVAELDLLCALSACPGGDCSATHSSDTAACYPLEVIIYGPGTETPPWQQPQRAPYDRSHGL